MKKSQKSQDKNNLILGIKVVPKAHQSEIIGFENDELKIRIKAIPAKGEANEELIAFLAKILNIAPSQITLLTKKSRHKRIQFEGITRRYLEEKLIIPLIKFDTQKK